jgi:transcriptional regulator with XRE-family HTH domain
MERSELLQSKEYWTEKIKLELFEMVTQFKETNNLTIENLADRLGVTKGYVSQILNGNFDHKISKLVDLALACNMVPVIKYEPISQYIQDDELDLCDEHYKDRPIIIINLGTHQTNSINTKNISSDAIY